MPRSFERARARILTGLLSILFVLGVLGWGVTGSADPDACLARCKSPVVAIDPPVDLRQFQGAPAPVAARRALSPTVPDVTRLHSRPGSRYTVFLDFDGADLAGTQWADLDNAPASAVVPRPDLDNRPGVDGNEQAIIEMVWRHVSEDFAPFDIDITTEPPAPAALSRNGSDDAAYGTTVVFAPDNWIHDWCNGCTGVASVGVFPMPQSDQWRQALVFPDYATQRSLGTLDYATIARFLGTTASHEIGHQLGLHHDGQTVGGPRGAVEYSYGKRPWGPIMGASAYPLTRWADGTAPFSNNPEDDLSVINGVLGRVPDEVDLLPLVPGLTSNGVIADATDRDTYTVVPVVNTTVSAQPAGAYADLDLALEVTDLAGRTTTYAPPMKVVKGQLTGMGASAPLKAGGIYRVTVRADTTPGVGSYGSLGRYSISLF